MKIAKQMIRAGVGVMLVAAIGGCAAGAASYAGNKPLPSGYTCSSLQSELASMDARGARAKVERASAGSASARDRKVADRYNELLNYYLGAGCEH